MEIKREVIFADHGKDWLFQLRGDDVLLLLKDEDEEIEIIFPDSERFVRFLLNIMDALKESGVIKNDRVAERED